MFYTKRVKNEFYGDLDLDSSISNVDTLGNFNKEVRFISYLP